MTGSDRGSASAELALLTPALLALAMLMVLAGRVVDARTTADEAAHAAARAASQERTVGAAQAAAASVSSQTLSQYGRGCADHSLVLDHGGLLPGGAVTAVVECRVSLTDLTGLGVPGSYTVQGESTVVVDTYRGRE